jgi:hypothetical protein
VSTTGLIRRHRWHATAASVVLAAGVVAALTHDDPTSGERAQRLLDQPGRFGSTTKAFDSLIEVADLATAQVTACRDRGLAEVQCEGWGALAAYSRVAAAATLQCTAPGRERIRREVRDYAAAVAGTDERATIPPQPAAAPTCR